MILSSKASFAEAFDPLFINTFTVKKKLANKKLCQVELF